VLYQLPDDGDVIEEIVTHTINTEIEVENNDGTAVNVALHEENEKPSETAAILDLALENTEMQEICY
jgi:hypothetical protein